MQVKKFEAKSMRDALEMVKVQLGPDAIILSAKDNSRGYGLAGQSSVEITAAVSEETLKKKKFVESRIRAQDREAIQKAPARVQKQFINSMVGRYHEENGMRKEITSTPYIDIEDDDMTMSAESDRATERVKSAAWNAAMLAADFVKSSGSTNNSTQTASKNQRNPKSLSARIAEAKNEEQQQTNEQATAEVLSLRKELAQLKSTLTQFQKIPQTFTAGQHPGADYGLPYDFASVFEKLTSAGVAPEFVGEMLTTAQKEMPAVKFKSKGMIDGWVARHILETTKIVGENSGAKIQVFMGPSGSGKTASLVKLAAHYVVNAHKKVALITTDTMKVGAVDQLRIYAQILNVPFAVVRNSNDWDYVIQQLSGYDYILCDTPGASLKTIEEIQMMKSLLPKKTEQANYHLVLSSTQKDQDLAEIGRRYKSLHFSDVIFSCLDDSAQPGTVYNFVKRFDVPLHSFGVGTRVPEDFEMATRERVLDLIFKLTKIKNQQEG
jgi:flagellar biosynthesis protein FlhF